MLQQQKIYAKQCTFVSILILSSINLFCMSPSQASQAIPEKYAVLVVCPGRSGSSCVSGVLNILGVEFGNRLLPAVPFNEKGLFEDRAFFAHNSNVLRRHLKLNYFANPRVIDWDKEPKRDLYREKIKELMEKKFAASDIFGIKNCFIAYMLPLYIEAALELGYTPKIVVMVRKPVEVAHSWKKMLKQNEKVTFEMIYHMIDVCFESIEQHSKGYDIIYIHFNDLLNQPEMIIDQLQEFIPGLKSFYETCQELEQFLDKKLKHENRKYRATL